MSVTRRESILRRKPYADRRSFIARAMGLSPIGDIASGGMTTGGVSPTLTWETATDWDNHVSEAGVVHESTGDTDHNDDTIVKMGYPYASFTEITPDPVGVWPLHEDSGSTANDVSGNNNDGSYEGGPTLGTTALLGTTAYDFNGSGDGVNIGQPSELATGSNLGPNVTTTAWVNCDTFDTGAWNNIIAIGGGGNDVWHMKSGRQTGDYGFYIGTNNGGGHVEVGTPINTGSWEFIAFSHDGNNNDTNYYVNGSNVYNSGSFGGGLGTTGEDWKLATRGNQGEYWDGQIYDARIYNTALSASQIQALYDVADTPGSLESNTKSFAASQTPDLTADVTLNGVTSFAVDVIGSPSGTSETNTVTVDTDGSNTYAITWSNSHTDFRVRPKPDNGGDYTITPTVNKLELVA